MSIFALRRLIGTCSAAALLLAASLTPSTAAAAAPSYDNLFIFGDSLSDTGNLSAATGFFFPQAGTTQPYFGGRYSDGLLWTEVLAAGLGLPGAANPLYQGGNNFAFAGARTGSEPAPIPGVLYQTQALWGGSYAAADPNALYVLVGGGNDMRDARTAAPGNSALEQSFRQLAATAAVANLKSSLGVLAAKGAKNVLVSNLPDLGNTPEAVGLGVVDASRDVTMRFNALMPDLLGYGSALGLTMSFLDMAGAVQLVRDDALNNGGMVYGITNVLTPCAGFFGSPGNDCATSAFSDDLHPSAAAHALIADAAFSALGVTPVPEPQTLALMLAGLLVVGRVAQRRAMR